MAVVGLVAGAGRFPFVISRAAARAGHRVAAAGLRHLVEPALETEVAVFEPLYLGEFQVLFDFWRRHGAHAVLMAGKVPKTLLADPKATRPDAIARQLLSELRDDSDDAFLGLVARAIEAAGFDLREQLAFTPELRAPRGVIGAHAPGAAARADLVFGWEQARAHGKSGAGQTVVVGEQRVHARESAMHTDDAIARGCQSAQGGPARVIKRKRPDQDPRFDLPTVGPETIRAMAQGGADLLAVEAGFTVLLERARLLRDADAAGIAVLGVDDALIAEWSAAS